MNPEGGTKRSLLVVVRPAGVLKEIRPEPVTAGTVIVILLDVTALGTEAAVVLSFNRLFAGTESKLEPVRLTDPAGAMIWGLNELICGAPVVAVTVYESTLVIEP